MAEVGTKKEELIKKAPERSNEDIVNKAAVKASGLTGKQQLFLVNWHMEECLNPHKHLRDIGYYREEKVKKKKVTKERSLKTYFVVPKNFQGFDRSLCYFEKKVGDFVFLPKDYATEYCQSFPVRFCPKCLLGPCISLIHHRDVCRMAADLSFSNQVSHMKVVRKCETLMRGFMRKVFGREYTTRVGLPCCVHQSINQAVTYMQTGHRKDDSEDDDSEDEEEE